MDILHLVNGQHLHLIKVADTSHRIMHIAGSAGAEAAWLTLAAQLNVATVAEIYALNLVASTETLPAVVAQAQVALESAAAVAKGVAAALV